jgi:predicted nucleotidyltransferase
VRSTTVLDATGSGSRRRSSQTIGSGIFVDVDAELKADLERYREALEKRFGQDLVTLALFGSQAQGRETATSDLDVLLVIRGLPKRRTERRALLRPIVRAIGDRFADSLSTIPLTPQEAVSVKPFYLGFLDGHRLLVDRDDFFRGVLDRLRQRLQELGARRLVDDYGETYWDLKPDYVFGEDVTL